MASRENGSPGHTDPARNKCGIKNDPLPPLPSHLEFASGYA